MYMVWISPLNPTISTYLTKKKKILIMQNLVYDIKYSKWKVRYLSTLKGDTILVIKIY